MRFENFGGISSKKGKLKSGIILFSKTWHVCKYGTVSSRYLKVKLSTAQTTDISK